MKRRRAEQAAGCLAGFTALNAIGGSIYGLAGAPKVPVEWLEGSPFCDYRVPSLVLGAAVGGTSTASALAAWKASRLAGPLTVAAGAVLTGWIAAQVAIIGPRSVLQPVMGGVGGAMLMLGRELS